MIVRFVNAQNLGKCALFVFILLLSGCGYKWGCGEMVSNYQTISVPYAIGDIEGTFTEEVIRAIQTRGFLTYSQNGGDLTLCLKILGYHDKNIGFRYDRDRNGEFTNSLIPGETRKTLSVEVTIVDVCQGCTLVGPTVISESVDFDHDYTSSGEGANIFSLGQLTDFDNACDAALCPLHIATAKKVVDYIYHTW